jgi:hypothetical protein
MKLDLPSGGIVLQMGIPCMTWLDVAWRMTRLIADALPDGSYENPACRNTLSSDIWMANASIPKREQSWKRQ